MDPCLLILRYTSRAQVKKIPIYNDEMIIAHRFISFIVLVGRVWLRLSKSGSRRVWVRLSK